MINFAQPIAYGRESKLFLFGDGQVIKIYNKGFPQSKIIQEFKNHQAVHNLIPKLVPKIYGMEKTESGWGIVLQYVAGRSLMSQMMSNPLKIFARDARVEKLARSIHKVEVTASNLPSQQQSFSDLISQSKRLTGHEKRLLLKLLQQNPQKKLCHGDFHIGNILEDNSGRLWLIDWMDAFIGEPLLDIALTAVNTMVSDAPNHLHFVWRHGYELLKKITRLDQKYLEIFSEYPHNKIRDMMLLASGIHLSRKIGNFDIHRKYFNNWVWESKNK